MGGDSEIPIYDIHPTSTAGGRDSFKDLPEKFGIRSEANFIRCQQCGWPLDKSQTSQGSGYGNITNAEVTSETVGGEITCREPIRGGGCPFCASSNYEPGMLDRARQEAR